MTAVVGGLIAKTAKAALYQAEVLLNDAISRARSTLG
jgi:hypothetical protein